MPEKNYIGKVKRKYFFLQIKIMAIRKLVLKEYHIGGLEAYKSFNFVSQNKLFILKLDTKSKILKLSNVIGTINNIK